MNKNIVSEQHKGFGKPLSYECVICGGSEKRCGRRNTYCNKYCIGGFYCWEPNVVIEIKREDSEFEILYGKYNGKGEVITERDYEWYVPDSLADKFTGFNNYDIGTIKIPRIWCRSCYDRRYKSSIKKKITLMELDENNSIVSIQLPIIIKLKFEDFEDSSNFNNVLYDDVLSNIMIKIAKDILYKFNINTVYTRDDFIYILLFPINNTKYNLGKISIWSHGIISPESSPDSPKIRRQYISPKNRLDDSPKIGYTLKRTQSAAIIDIKNKRNVRKNSCSNRSNPCLLPEKNIKSRSYTDFKNFDWCLTDDNKHLIIYKLVSKICGYATAKINKYILEYNAIDNDSIFEFDDICKTKSGCFSFTTDIVINVRDTREVFEYMFYNTAHDYMKHCISMNGNSPFTSKLLYNEHLKKYKNIVYNKFKNEWLNLPAHFRYGTFIKRTTNNNRKIELSEYNIAIKEYTADWLNFLKSVVLEQKIINEWIKTIKL